MYYRYFQDEHSSSSEESSDDEQPIQIPTVRREDFLRSNIHKNNTDQENVEHVVQNEKEKRSTEIKEIIKKLKQAISIRNINKIYECFEKLTKAYDKAHQVIEDEQKIPEFYIEILNELNNFLNHWREKLDTTNSNNLNILHQKFYQYIKQHSFEKEINISDENNIDKFDQQTENDINNDEEKLNKIISLRGKHSMNYQNQLEYLNTLRQNVETENLNIKILFTQIITSFDYLNQGNEHLKQEIWINILDYIEELLTLLSKNINLNINYDDLISIIIQMNENFTKILQNIDYHNQDYIVRLKDEFRICSILNQIKNYFELEHHKHIQSQYLSIIYLYIIEHIYYKYDKTSDQSSFILINHLCKYIYTTETLNDIHIRANLYHIYYLALNNYYNESRNLMLMSHIQDIIDFKDISIKILYNRTIIQLGLCAFRFGSIDKAHQALVDIQSGNQIKELLGQNIHNMYIPYHMHINLQLIEWIYLISAMIIDISSKDKHLMSKHFYHIMHQAEKQPILGPPESMREHIVAASHAMKIGDWNACVNFLINDKMNNKIWNLIPHNTEVFQMLVNKIKEESLRIYLFTYGNTFSSISILTLIDIFELSRKQVYGIICKMIINSELMASIDDINQIVIMHEKNLSKIQILSTELMDKTLRLYEQNNKLNYFFFKSPKNNN